MIEFIFKIPANINQITNGINNILLVLFILNNEIAKYKHVINESKILINPDTFEYLYIIVHDANNKVKITNNINMIFGEFKLMYHEIPTNINKIGHTIENTIGGGLNDIFLP